MNTTTLTNEHFEALRSRYGSHSAAARHLGIDRRHYLRIRRGIHQNTSTMRYILAEATAAMSEPQPEEAA